VEPKSQIVALKDNNTPIKSRNFAQIAEPFFREYCYSCHGKGEKLRGDFDLTHFASAESIVEDRDVWELILELVETEEMPTKKPLPSSTERAEFVEWLHGKLDEVDWTQVKHAGYVAMPLLNKKEYSNTIRDLLGVDFGVGEILFADGEGESGFTTDRSNLFLSPASIEKYLEAAEEAIGSLEQETAQSGTNSKSKNSGNSLNKTIQAEDMLSTGGGKATVKGVSAVRLLVGQTTIYDSFSVPVDGEYIFELRGTSFNNDNASIRVAINGKLEANLTFPGKDYTTQSFKMHLDKGDHRMEFNKGTNKNKRTTKNGVKIFHKESDLDWVRIKYDKTDSPNIVAGVPLYSFKPIGSLSEIESVRKTLTHFLLRSFRRPVDEEILSKYITLYSKLREQGGSYSFSLKQAMISILVSPRFLYRYELAPNDTEDAKEYKLDHFQVASRLSYFLWLSMPDQELLAKAMKAETILTFEHLISKDLSLITLIDSQATYLNEQLAQHYGIDGVKGDHMRPFALKDKHRGGLLGMGSILTALLRMCPKLMQKLINSKLLR